MNVLQLSALALPLLGTPDATEAEGEWLGLDQEIQSLASNLNTTENPSIWGFLIARFANTSDGAVFGGADADPGVPADISGFSVPFARINFGGNVGDYSYHIETDFGQNNGSEGTLLDANMSWNCGEAMTATFGVFKNPFSRMWNVERNDLAFQHRASSFINAGSMVRDTGIQLGGDQGTFNWAVAVQDGTDGDGDEYRISARAEVDVMGDGVPTYNGGYGVGDTTSLQIGVGFTDDGGGTDTDALTADAVMVMAPWTFALYFFDNGAGYGDNSPFIFALTWMFNEEWEAGLQYTDADVADVTRIELVLNWYMGSNDNKWQFGLLQQDNGVDGTLIQVQRVLSF